MSVKDDLWDNIPDWDGPEHLYEMMCAYRDAKGKVSRALDNEFTGQLLRVTWMNFAKHHYGEKLRGKGADIEESIQKTALHLRKQSLNGFNLAAEGWRPMMTTMNTAVRNYALTEIRRHTRRHLLEANATDHFGDREGEEVGLDSESGPGDSKCAGDLDGFKEEAEDAAIGDVVCVSGVEQRRLERLFGEVWNQILEEQTPLPYSELPFGLREVSREQHGIVVARTVRSIRRFAGSN